MSCVHLVNIFPVVVGMLYQEKSGSPGAQRNANDFNYQ
jgi:hypothetical protein